MEIPAEMIVDFDYLHADKIVKVLKPVIWQDGDSFCCLLGPDPMVGVFGCGDTPEDATDDWQDSLKNLMERAKPGDAMVGHIKEKLVEEAVRTRTAVEEFENQFRPGKKM